MEGDSRKNFVGKSYQVATETLQVIHLSKSHQSLLLSATVQLINWKVSSDRVIVENAFGSLPSLWTIINFHNPFFKTALSLNNFHMKKLAVQENIQDYFRGTRNRLLSTSLENLEYRRLEQDICILRLCRCVCLKIVFWIHFTDLIVKIIKVVKVLT